MFIYRKKKMSGINEYGFFCANLVIQLDWGYACASWEDVY